MISDIYSIPRAKILALPTPLQELKRLSTVLGGPRIFIKRDDMTGLALGGNKSRKLEFLLGDALSQGCDTVITGGGTQSNCCRQTAAAVAAVGLECHLALGGVQPEFADGNLLLDILFGATVQWCGENNKGELIPEIADKLSSKGRKVYQIPYGASNAIGGIGFTAAIGELKEQLAERELNADYIILPSSSGGTHAGIKVGVDAFGLSAKIIGIGIDRDGLETPSYEAELAALSNEIANVLGLSVKYTERDFEVTYDYLGGGYGVIGELEREAMQLAGKYEGILLDPVYTARAMGAVLDMIRKNKFASDETIVLWHTGGTPAIFQHARELGRIENSD